MEWIYNLQNDHLYGQCCLLFQFVQKFNRQPKTVAEGAIRKAQFSANVAFSFAQNAKQVNTYDPCSLRNHAIRRFLTYLLTPVHSLDTYLHVRNPSIRHTFYMQHGLVSVLQRVCPLWNQYHSWSCAFVSAWYFRATMVPDMSWILWILHLFAELRAVAISCARALTVLMPAGRCQYRALSNCIQPLTLTGPDGGKGTGYKCWLDPTNLTITSIEKLV